VCPNAYIQCGAQIEPGNRGLDWEQALRGKLARFGVQGDLQDRPIADLSGGQRSRVAFCAALILKPHVLILDEPTNNLDIESVEVTARTADSVARSHRSGWQREEPEYAQALIAAINQFSGGVLVISHDQHFVNSIARELWVLQVAHTALHLTQQHREGAVGAGPLAGEAQRLHPVPKAGAGQTG
jgi:ATP-binding cassette subfamily F protein 3